MTTRRRVGRKMPTVSEPSFASVTTAVSLARNVAANATLREKRRSPINNISFLVDRLCTSAVFVSSNVPIFGKNDARVCSGKYTADDDFASVVPERGICTIDRRRSIRKKRRGRTSENFFENDTALDDVAPRPSTLTCTREAHSGP